MSPVYRFVLGSSLGRGRLAAVGAGGLFVVALGAAVGRNVTNPAVAFELLANLGFALLLPVAALAYASSALGDPAEDGTLVYLWLRPVARWRIAVASAAGVGTVVLPLVGIPLAAAAALAGREASLVGGVVAGGGLALLAYTTLFLGFGLIVQRAFFWGLLYVLI